MTRQAVQGRTDHRRDVWITIITTDEAVDRVAMDMTCNEHRQYFFLHAGGGEVELDGWHTTLVPGEVLFVPSSAIARLRLMPGSRLFHFGVSDGFLISRVLPALGLPFAPYSREFPVPRKLSDWAALDAARDRDRVSNELELAARRLGGPGDAAVAAYVMMLLFERSSAVVAVPDSRAAIDSWSTADGVGAPSAEAALVVAFRSLVEEHLLEQWKVQDYCDALHVRPIALMKACKTVLGTTPSSIIHDRLLLDAKRHLTFSRMSAARIAYELGFTDAAYFSRYFKKRTGQSPLEFRRARGPTSTLRPVSS